MTRKFLLINKYISSTPLPVLDLAKFKEQANPKNVKKYQEKVGTVFYTVVIIRPDIVFIIV
jgi:Asp/Glu/hydantoin racemase